ncbi:hypothetical protein HNQ94_000618 [Salirhabdus euzebyi]|uniref:CAAX prenyl protease 2/Lysostaphin resistance protein A-like domain-containing protein n=1 Tax=Salirhabdus euzebyi TaxID=394506 RepID=A0A841Q1L1_9BACI|nr:CPBP family intramembrane glutamic endopeptidase [Salirhabdus euzebyi]MBB6452173.1 hypothetical protein [Salirhabdus euzebyi]
MRKQSRQAELIKRLTDKELLFQLYLSQGFILLLALGSSYFLFDSFTDWKTLYFWDINQLIYFAIIPAVIIVIIDLVLMKYVPKKHYDDGGINERIFTNRSFIQIFIITSLVAISEEMLFRGVIHHTFGYLIGSLSFALVHFRYLFKPVLLISILFISFLIGYMYELTNNLLVTTVSHFLVDFLLALFIKFKWGGQGVNTYGEKTEEEKSL